jgi:GT2 family glycosyltransferase
VTPSGTAILLLNWNGWEDTLECLESVFRLVPGGHTVIVCDNASDDGSLERVQEWARGVRDASAANPSLRRLITPPVARPVRYAVYDRAAAERGGSEEDRDAPLILIRTGDNLGFAGGNNVGLRYALARPEIERVWLVNNDAVVAPDALARLVAAMEVDPQIGICGSRVMHYHEPERVQALGGGSYSRWLALPRLIGEGLREADLPPTEAVLKRLAYVTGASMLVSRAFLEEIGLMSEEYFLYFEELDWALRARGRFHPGVALDSVVYHKEGRSIGTRGPQEKSALSDRHFMANRLRITRKFHPRALLPVRGALLVAAARRAARGDLDRARLVLDVLKSR